MNTIFLTIAKKVHEELSHQIVGQCLYEAAAILNNLYAVR